MSADRRRTKGNVLKDYDLELAVMQAITNLTGYQWSQAEISEITGVTHQRIRQIEQEGCRRAWRVFHRDKQFIKELNESRGLDGSKSIFLP